VLAQPVVTVAIVSAVWTESAAMRVLVEDLRPVPGRAGDRNHYQEGWLPSADPGRPHRVALVLLPQDGNGAASSVCTDLFHRYPGLGCVVMCGMAGGVPCLVDPARHVRLGDIVVADSVISYGHVRRVDGEVVLRRPADGICADLMRAFNEVRAGDLAGVRSWHAWLDGTHERLAPFARPAAGTDVLFDAGVQVPHPSPAVTGHTGRWPKVHCGPVGSADVLLRDAAHRDDLAARHRLLGVEMEAAGIAAAAALRNKAWFVVRGIVDYCDNNGKNDVWHRYSSLAAAAYLRALLAACHPFQPSTPALVLPPEHRAAPLYPRWPHRVGALPLLADCRQQRRVDRDLAAAVAASGAVACQVLTGLGGVGKTQTAAALAQGLWDSGGLDLLIWINSARRTGVIARYAQAAAHVTGTHDTDPEQAAERLLSWLATTTRRWLIVLDDLTDPNEMAGIWPPVTSSGRTVVTTRRRDSALLAGRQQLDVDTFTADEAHRYFRAKLGRRAGQLCQSEELARELDYLPLAVAHAAAYIQDQGTSCAEYRRRLANRKLSQLSPGAIPDGYRATMAATFSLAIESANILDPVGLARPVVELAAVLDADAIPTGIFATPAALDFCAHRAERAVDADDSHDALRLLHRFSLVAIDDTTGSVRIHHLVQRAVREATDPAEQQALITAAADALGALWPVTVPGPAPADTLRRNAAALRAIAGRRLWTDDGAHPVVLHAGKSLGDTGSFSAAVDYLHDLYRAARQRLGTSHPYTLNLRYHLGRWLGETGQYRAAIAAFEALLPDCQQILGNDHPETLTIRRDRAWFLGQTGNHADAYTAAKQVVDDYLDVLGPHHPDTMYARHSLAHWHGMCGHPADALAAMDALLAECTRLHGPDHPVTLSTRLYKAGWQGWAGDPASAATQLQHLLTDALHTVDPEHSYALSVRRVLGHWHGEAGDRTRATRILDELLTDCRRILGPDHIQTRQTRYSLQQWRPSYNAR
jgi:nucleoside phosphorylase